ncbi:hypothetical protein E2C01_078065 [Portunus trituberculatus]|uniref:Uncharacterized protein n=1 Tax=Portunus trituberculatus TaxID=210409 RepID=A0A5B7INX7_PORTR|nr:hypothetical protein [Portunus trituberculatus]
MKRKRRKNLKKNWKNKEYEEEEEKPQPMEQCPGIPFKASQRGLYSQTLYFLNTTIFKGHKNY